MIQLLKESEVSAVRLTLSIGRTAYILVPLVDGGWALHKRHDKKPTVYRVWLERGWPTCTCEAFAYGRGTRCRHIVACEAVGLLPRVSDAKFGTIT